MRQPELVFHADWSGAPRGRVTACARLSDGGYVASAPATPLRTPASRAASCVVLFWTLGGQPCRDLGLARRDRPCAASMRPLLALAVRRERPPRQLARPHGSERVGRHDQRLRRVQLRPDPLPLGERSRLGHRHRLVVSVRAVWKSVDAGSTWTEHRLEQSVRAVARGRSWQRLPRGLPTDTVFHVAVDASGRTVYADPADCNGVWRTRSRARPRPVR
jgi:hypothetical protein